MMHTGVFHRLLMAIIAQGRDHIHQAELRMFVPGLRGTAGLMAIITGVFGRIMHVVKFKQIAVAFLASRGLRIHICFLYI
jgi:hypothetical protein